MTSPRLEKVTPENVDAACELRVHPEQEGFVAPVIKSLAQAYAYGDLAWPRLIFDGDELVGFVMAHFDPRNPVASLRAVIWRLNIAASRQGRGYGRFAVVSVCAEARRRGYRRVTVLWEPGGPEEFYRRLGFRRTGAEHQGELVGELTLD